MSSVAKQNKKSGEKTRKQNSIRHKTLKAPQVARKKWHSNRSKEKENPAGKWRGGGPAADPRKMAEEAEKCSRKTVSWGNGCSAS